MFRKLLILTGGVIFACGTSAWGGNVNYTELSAFGGPGLVNVAAPATNTSTSGGVNGVGAGFGATYINTYTGTPGLNPGNNFKSIGSFVITNYLPQGLPPSSTAGVGGQVVAVFALQGTLTGSGTSFGATFNQGVINYYNLPAGGYIANSLATWGINPANLVGSYVLKDPGAPNNPVETVAPTTASNIGAYNSNRTTAQTAGVPVSFVGLPAGTFSNLTGGALFRDAGTFSGTTFTPTADIFDPAGNTLAASYGRTVNGPGGSSFGTSATSFLLPGFVGDFTDTFQNSGNPAFQIGNTDIAIANAFFFTAASTTSALTLPDGTVLPGAGLLMDGGFPFATIGTGTATDYQPNFNGGSTSTGDFAATNTSGNEFAPTLEPGQVPPPGVPEIDPNSIAGALTLLAGGLLYLTDRCRRLKK